MVANNKAYIRVIINILNDTCIYIYFIKIISKKGKIYELRLDYLMIFYDEYFNE